MDFPITDLMDEQACYAQLVELAASRRPGLPPLPSTTIAWSSIVAAATRSWTSAAATAIGSSTPSPARPCTASGAGPANWS